MDPVEHVFNFGLSTLPPQGKCILAVSGGLDSMVLLHLASRFLDKSRLIVAHFDHNTRKTSKLDAKHVEKSCKAIGIRFRMGKYGRKWKTRPSENVLRILRRNFLKKMAKEVNASAILSAHQANDQMETFFMRLMRGTSARGLKAIPSSRGLFRRPLLSISREQILIYANTHQVKWREDETNQDVGYLRNAVRYEILPAFFALSRNFGDESQILEKFQTTLTEISTLVARAESRAKRQVKRAVVKTPFWFRFSSEMWNGLLNGEREYFLRRLARELGVTRITRATLRKLSRALDMKNKELHVTQGLTASYSCGHWFFRNKEQQKTLESQIEFKAESEQFSHPVLGLFVPEKGSHLTIRTPANGDRIRSTKLKKILLEKRIPRLERKILPVAIGQDQEVHWFLSEPTKPGVMQRVRCEFPFTFLH